MIPIVNRNEEDKRRKSGVKLPCSVILASASPRRKELLSGMGIDFTVIPAGVEEISAGSGYSAAEMVRLNAGLKARAVSETHPDSLVIGSDTVVVYGDRIFGKPRTADEGAAMLRTLSGRVHQVMTGVSLRLENVSLDKSFTVISRVVFKVLSEADIQEYMRLVEVMDKAGAYAVQEHGELILERLEGSLSNVIGLPVERLQLELTRIAGEISASAGS